MKRVSIIVPMYNVAQYLETCIQSVLDQELNEREMEVIMVNDESPDNSLEVAEGLAKKYSFIKIISQKNRGLGGARNTGMRNAEGKYLVFLDSDDRLLPRTLKKLLVTAEANDLDILEFGAQKESESGEIVGTISVDGKQEIFNGIAYYDKIKYLGSACNKLYRLDYIKTNELFFLEKIYGEDFEFNTRALYYAKRIMATDFLGASFLQSDNSITRNKSRAMKDKYVGDFIKILRSIDKFAKDKMGNAQAADFFKERLTTVCINTFFFLFKNKYSFSKMKEVRGALESEGLFYRDYPITEKKRELFRKIMLKNFGIFKLTQPIIRIL